MKAGETTYHVQTEDCGTTNALIDTTVYFHGRVLHRRTNNYFDLLPLDAERQQTLKLRIDEQHRTVVEQIQTGALSLALPAEEKPAAVSPQAASAQTSGVISPASSLKLELLNPKTWLTGKRASLQIAVHHHAGKAVGGAVVIVNVDGAAAPAKFSTVTDGSGNARLQFEMPRLSNAEAALIVEAFKGMAKGQLRFQLRIKPRVPSTS